MKTAFGFSVLLNIVLVGGLFFLVNHGQKVVSVQVPPPAPKVSAQVDLNTVKPAKSEAQPQPFRWSQLKSGHDYRRFIGNLRASGCPESTVRDIVQGNVSRGFAWERSRLGIDDFTDGPWSKASEMAFIADLLQTPGTMDNIGSAGISSEGYPGSPAQQSRQAAANGWNAGGAVLPDVNPGGETAVASQNAGSSGYVPAYYGGNGAVANSGTAPTSGSQTQPALADNSGQNHNSTGWTPQDNSPNSFSPSDSPDQNSGQNNSSWDSTPPVGPPDPLGPNDPNAKSALDKQMDEINEYAAEFEAYVVASEGYGSVGFNPTDPVQ